jgi:F-type H+-transporting ATP synthase subunit e
MQVLRWSALGLGIFYGFSHQRSINATQKAAHDKHEFEKKQKAIDAAKAEFAKRHPAPSSGSKDRMYKPSIRSFLDGMPGLLFPTARAAIETEQWLIGLLAVVTDPSDPKFDLEKLLLKVSEDKA